MSLPAKLTTLAVGAFAALLVSLMMASAALAEVGVISSKVDKANSNETSAQYSDADGSSATGLDGTAGAAVGKRHTTMSPDGFEGEIQWILSERDGGSSVLLEYEHREDLPVQWVPTSKPELSIPDCQEPYFIPPRTIVCTRFNSSTAAFELVKFTLNNDGTQIVSGPTPVTPATGASAAVRTTLAAVEGSFVFPSYSPVTKRIVAWNVDDDSIWIMDEDGANAIKLTGSGENRRHPSINEQGTAVFYSRNFEIWSVNADGSGGEVQVTSGFCCDAGPSLSPDGSEVYFHRKVGGGADDFEVFAIHPSGSGLRQVTDNDSSLDDLFPQPFTLEPAADDPGDPGDPPAAQCADGADNDGDGRTDFPADPGCTDAADDDETDPTGDPGDPGDPVDDAACQRAKQKVKKAKKQSKKAAKKAKKAAKKAKKAKKKSASRKTKLKAAKKAKKAKKKAKQAKKKLKRAKKKRKKKC